MLISDALCTKILESVRDGIALVDQSGKIVWTSRSLENMFGYDRGELLNQPIEILVADKSKGKHKKWSARFLLNPQKRPSIKSSQFEGRRKDGSSNWVQIGLDYHRENGNLLAIAVVTDKTGNRKADARAVKNAEMAQLFFNLSKALFIELDEKGRVKRINEEGLHMLEYTEADVLGKNWFDYFILPVDVASLQAVFNDLMKGKISHTEFVNSHIITKSGKTKLIQWHNSVVYDDDHRPTGTISSGIDVTAVKELKTAQTEAILIGAEKERKRVALELHDGIVQTLSAISMNLKSFEDNIKLLPEDNQIAYHDALKLVIDSIADTRAISHDLMPSALVRHGLVGALDGLAARIAKYHNISVAIDPDDVSDGLSEIDHLNLYRIIQELVQNTIKHAKASSITIKLRRNDVGYTIVFQDNGLGFNTSVETAKESGLGLRNIMTRVGSMNGDFKIKSSHKGIRVTISIPVSF